MNLPLKKVRGFFRHIGPGITTGASDDDPSGIATYSIAGAQANYQALWMPIFLLPLMITIQEMSARIGMVTGHGLAGNMRRAYPRVFLYIIAVLIMFANAFNIGANLSGMAAATHLVLPLPNILFSIIFGLVMIGLMIRVRYRVLARVLKWLTFAVFAYILSAIVTKQDWAQILYHTFVPSVQFSKEFLILAVAILGTTISPYLFFWQASEEVEDRDTEGRLKKRHRVQIVTKNELKVMREDVSLGMMLSNVVMFFIIATTASTLFQNGIHSIETIHDAALALRPIAGDFAFLLFTVGIVGTGLLSIPVLAGSAAYVAAESFGWREGLENTFHKAKLFYAVIVFATILGMVFPFLGIPPIKALYITAIVYGIISPILILFILHMANRTEIMGVHTNGLSSNVLGLVTFILMASAAISLVVF